ncbi:hypothetical protein [Adhaeretor mobilis]|uniref:Uncharacterized protein n=1 Tax=Adhaeretor mobilis TaxID=1930276 RepID=A0A517N0S6_9BACT|nr:hypothetical protein [Adhaeretor mobilis]QDT00628.1 hypothetical protein HG15A2_39670 [Adhaeretor mobilis]
MLTTHITNWLQLVRPIGRTVSCCAVLFVGLQGSVLAAQPLFDAPGQTAVETIAAPMQQPTPPQPAPPQSAPPQSAPPQTAPALIAPLQTAALPTSCFAPPELPVSTSPVEVACRPSPGYMRGPLRHGIAAPVNPAVVSAHAPPWEQIAAGQDPKAKEQPLAMRFVPHLHDCQTCEADYSSNDFSPDPISPQMGFDSFGELQVYGCKNEICAQRPLCERPLPLYPTGPWPPSYTFLGSTNLVQPKFFVYGDFRTAIAQNRNNGNTETPWNSRLNLELDFWITSTERIHAFWGPLDEGQQFTGILFDDGDADYQEHYDGFDQNTDALYFEGDMGQILGGFRGIEAPFDAPFAVGLIPLLFQNGVWLEDSFVGAAATIPARNSPGLDWSNFDTTFFVGWDELTTRAFDGPAADQADFVGATTFIERRGGYLEAGWAYVNDVTDESRSYHNFAFSYTRRYANLVSNSARLIINQGQEGPRDLRTADGYLLLLENSFLTRNPYHVVPYANLFAGFGRPQPLGRLQGVLKNTGINFESDLLTGYPILDDTANNTYGAALGVDLLGNCLEQQLLLEFATVQGFDSEANRNAAGDQYAFGMRYQKPLNQSLILRTDAMYGWLENEQDISGMRVELRRKF